jgi:hypothetical protein
MSEPRIVQGDVVRDTALASKLKVNTRAIHLGVAIAHGRQTERVVVASILVATNADQRFLEELDDGGQHLLAWQARPAQIRSRPFADSRERGRECDQAPGSS